MKNYSFQDFTGQWLSFEKDLLKSQTIRNSCFSQESPDTHVFPENMTGITFINCNLDNVFIPQGNTIVGGSIRRFKVQNDLRDWEVDELGTPIRVLNEKYWSLRGFSTDPVDIPRERIKAETFEDHIKLESKIT